MAYARIGDGSNYYIYGESGWPEPRLRMDSFISGCNHLLTVEQVKTILGSSHFGTLSERCAQDAEILRPIFEEWLRDVEDVASA